MWMPVKIVVSGDQAEVYFRDLDEPLLHITDLKLDEKGGPLGFYSEHIPGMTTAVLYISNYRYKKQEAPALASKIR